MQTGPEKIEGTAEGLFYLSEGDYPFEVISLANISLSIEDQLLALSGKPKGTPVEVVTLEHFFRNQIKAHPDASTEQKQIAERFQTLERVLNEELIEVKVYRIGEIHIDAFIVGQLPDGTYAGLRTTVIET